VTSALHDEGPRVVRPRPAWRRIMLALVWFSVGAAFCGMTHGTIC
jgi:hypothetical protein